VIDRELLLQHARMRDTAGGYEDTFVHPEFGSGRTVAVVSRPLADQRPIGWVICHSFAMEQLHLGRLEVAVARGLASAGFPVIRYHGQGYGDSEVGMDRIGLSSHVSDALDAVALLREDAGVREIGVVGARFGGTVAALVARRASLPYLVACEPVVSGSRFMLEFLSTRVMSEWAGTSVRGDEGAETSGMGSLRTQLATRGWADVKGFPLRREAHDEIAAIELGPELRGYRGRTLLISISRTDRPSVNLRKLVESLPVAEVTCSVEVIQDRLAPQFGQFHFQTIDGGRAKVDVQVDLEAEIVRRFLEWVARTVANGPSEMASDRR
jgi:pimeloyl-ACP methyl ester carboxylesterase